VAAEVKCAGCDQPIKIREETYTVERGAGKRQKLWGKFHIPCFNQAFDSPECMMEEIRRTSSEPLNE
jgi:hypothetical protein